MPSVVDFGTRTTMPEGGCIVLWRTYLLGNLSWGFVWFVPAFWIMELLFCCVALVSVISPWAWASLQSMCNKTGITISPSWLENSQGFDKYSCYFLLNHFKQKQRSKEKKKWHSCNSCQMKQQPGRSPDLHAPKSLSLLFNMLHISHIIAIIQILQWLHLKNHIADLERCCLACCWRLTHRSVVVWWHSQHIRWFSHLLSRFKIAPEFLFQVDV